MLIKLVFKIFVGLRKTLLRSHFFQINIFCGTTRGPEIVKAIQRLFLGSLTLGPSSSAYETTFAKLLGRGRCFGFATGRMALYAILQTLNIQPGDEVIIPAFTCVVVPNAIIYAGAKPIYCDIETERFSINPRELETKITPRTKAIIAQHTFGIPCLIDDIMKIGAKYDIPVIEDCAHTIGASDKGRPLGAIGYASFFSTDHTKIISTGIGGIAFSRNAECLKKLEDIYNETPFLSSWQIRRQILTFALFFYLTHPRVYWLSKYFLAFLIKSRLAMFITDYLSITKPTHYPFPARLADVHAEIGISQLSSLRPNLDGRKEAVNAFEQITRANDTIFANQDLQCAWLRYPILIENRSAFLKDLEKYFDLGIWFTTVTECRNSNFEAVGYTAGTCPVAEKIVGQIVSLPTHARVWPKDMLLRALRRLSKTSQGTFIYDSSGKN